MDRWMLLAAVALAAIAAVQGVSYLAKSGRSRMTVVWMLGVFICQLSALGVRGEMRGSCPLGDTGEIFVFAAWAVTMCYLAVGSVFRLSLLGVFTAPLVCALMSAALIPGMMEVSPEKVKSVDGWREIHAAFSVLAYGALGLAAVSCVMFLVLDRQLKGGVFTKGLFKNLPPVRELSLAARRLLWLGLLLLTIGVVSGIVMKTSGPTAAKHLYAAAGQWLAYLFLLIVSAWRGIPPKQFAMLTVLLFLLSLMIFALL